MNTFNLENMPLSELRELSTAVAQELQHRKKDEVKKTAQQIKALAAELDMSVDEILQYGNRGKRGKVPPKYQNPNNLKQSWSGRGRKPEWVAALLKQGKTLEDLAIHSELV
jgi:DNA-binding protein H-NS